MKRALKIIGLVLLLLITFIGLKMCDFGPEPARPDLDLPPAPQMAEPASAPMDMAFAPRNLFAATGVNPMPHGDPAQQDATPLPGPMDKTRRLEANELVYRFLGPGYFGAFNSSEYPDGRRLLWANGVNGVYKLDYETYEIYDHLPSENAEKYTQEWAENISAKLDKNNGASALLTGMKAMLPLKSLSGVYAMVGANNWFYFANKDGSIVAYGDEIEGDAGSKIVEKARFQLPADAAGASVGMNMTYDGWIVFPTEEGTTIAVSPDLKNFHSVKLNGTET